ncbi:tyrosine-type recombinase/integrase [Rheinheimera sp. MMS21-TC3]|uniref:tyrosine-type recombinase/integrase n=1 Tax=Rheinheimera sp. MMS21-TC3 TaxID=3072790 RepID=UPI0028C3D7F3|nr:tyrosine-type recombinase/integrase [Rheinheimera sp. MMS21-TC3]WNO60870.1 tyrosine-type recombinase/integrase [Rheinheimera sp. MMS21-TC3]
MMKSVALSITDAAVVRSAADLTISELRDQRHPLALRLHKSRTKGTWYLVRYEEGKKVRQRLGYWPALKTKDAQSIVPEILKKLATGTDVQNSGFATVGQLLKWYLGRIERESVKSDSRRKGVKCAIEKHLLPRLASIKITELTKLAIDERLMLPLQNAALKPSTIRQYFAVLKRAFKSAGELGLVSINPMASMRFGDHIQRRIEPKQGRLLVSDAGRTMGLIMGLSEPIKTMLLFMLMYATRVGETRKLKWCYFDFEANRISIPAAITKTDSNHVMPITEQAKAVLLEFREHSQGEYLFEFNRKEFTHNDAQKLIRAVSAGKFSAHDLRKLARSAWATIGIDYWVGERMLNHKQKGLDAVYIKADALDVKHAALTQYHEWLNTSFNTWHNAGIDRA